MFETDIDYEPMSEEEALGLLPKGDYDSTFVSAENKTSSSGKKYVVFTLNVKGNDIQVWCTFPFMLKHASESIGCKEKYENKSLKLSDFPGKKCIARVKVQEGNDKYPKPKNIIWDFLPFKQQELPFDDSVPF